MVGLAPAWTFIDLCRPLADRALARLAEDRKAGYPQTTHRMSFRRAAGFVSGPESQAGDVFSRALVADALCDARDVGLYVDNEGILEAEASYLASRQQSTYPWGWCYFPDLPELGPDADDVAQVGQVILRVRGAAAAATLLQRPIGVILANQRANGAIRTWLGTPGDAESGRTLQEQWVSRAWGDTEDPEVVANVLYLLALWDDERFDQEMRIGAAYVAAAQATSGCWYSTWYSGPFYGTYVACRALAVSESARALHGALEYLLTTQRPGGDWGADGVDGQLSTALALCCLSVIAERIRLSDTIHTAVFAGLSQLATSSAEGCWSHAPLIQMRQSLAGADDAKLYFGSESLTAAFVLKAAAAWANNAGGIQ